MALTKITGQVVDTTTDLVVGVTTVGGGVSAVDGFFSGIVTFSQGVSIGGTLTYEDVTNIDSVGLITARNGIVVGSGITLSKDGDGFFTGVTTATTFVGALTGNVTGNVTGNISGGTVAGSTGTFTGDVDIADKIVHTGDTDTAIRFSGADTITAETAGSEVLRITSDSKIGINDTSPDSALSITGTGSDANTRISITDGGVANVLGRYGNLSLQADEAGAISGSLMQFKVDGTEQARITAAGAFGIGESNPSYRLHVTGGAVDQTASFDNTKTTDGQINYIGVSLGNFATTGKALFGITGHSTAASQSCWIGMAGDDVAGGYGLKVFRGGNACNMQRFAVGTLDPAGYVSGTDASLVVAYAKTFRFGLYIRPTDNDTGGGQPALFANQSGTAIGSIGANASNVTFNTSSDYRLKENDVSIIDGITRLKKLRPIRFNWKTDTEKTVDGFLAHEVSSSVPESVTGEKDGVNEDGSIKPQQLDQSKLVPLLTAALQEAVTKIEALEARVATLEG